MKRENYITILKTSSVSEIEGLQEIIDEINSYVNIKLEKEDIPAFFSDFCGEAINLFLTSEVQALVNVFAIGKILCKLKNIITDAGKAIFFSKGIAKFLLFFKAAKEQGLEENEIQQSICWGPMTAEALSDNLTGLFHSKVDSMTDQIYFMAVVFPVNKHKVRTIWQLISADGSVHVSWATQTYEDRVTEFLNPLKPNSY